MEINNIQSESIKRKLQKLQKLKKIKLSTLCKSLNAAIFFAIFLSSAIFVNLFEYINYCQIASCATMFIVFILMLHKMIGCSDHNFNDKV
ncbi:hypothetical protein SAMN05428964_11221 [Thalassospira xiamenensis]|uniref:Uncharacterized protein n=1 Tax=Thalassospira xiamenensis TaxID=220697 RepID=A0A285TY19_9PROT|nr:hypothetical protein SAMN05428964_11221 [Thalassospira xiamenensis]